MGTMGQFYSQQKTGGPMLNFAHNTSTFGGDVIDMSMAQGSGGFTGQFLNFTTSNASKFTVGALGDVTLAGDISIGSYAAASLGAVRAAGTLVFCNNCTTAGICTSGGTEHLAVSNGLNWVCQ